jgi:hypothetical protein
MLIPQQGKSLPCGQGLVPTTLWLVRDESHKVCVLASRQKSVYQLVNEKYKLHLPTVPLPPTAKHTCYAIIEENNFDGPAL